VRKALDTLYDAAGYLAAFFMVGILLMVLASVVGRMAGFNLRGSDAYAGYAMAAAGFLALAQASTSA
jgi:TRAP-type C4-dicarboxylate transport system permease small subunit